MFPRNLFRKAAEFARNVTDVTSVRYGRAFSSSNTRITPSIRIDGKLFSSVLKDKDQISYESSYLSECSNFSRSFSSQSSDLEPDEDQLHISDEELHEITKGDPQLVKTVKYIILEHHLLRQEGALVPSKIKLSKWKELIKLNSKNARKRFFEFLFKTEMKAKNDKIRKLEKRQERINKLSDSFPTREEDIYGVTYGVSRNTLFLRIYDSTINKFYHSKVFQAMQFSQPLVFDMSYDDDMNDREASNCAKQLELILTQNRTHKEPFNYYFCNASENNKILKFLLRRIPNIYDDDYALNITSASYLDIFEKKELVYLTPYAREELKNYDDNEIYIIGAMVDKVDPKPLSMAKAKRQNIKTKKLPLDRFLDWGIGNKSLTLNQIAAIMLDLRTTKNWFEAFKHVPRRKLKQDSPLDGQFQRKEKRSLVLQDDYLLTRTRGIIKHK